MTYRSFYKRVSKLDTARQFTPTHVEREALANIIAYLDELAARKVIGDQFIQSEIKAVNQFLKAP